MPRTQANRFVAIKTALDADVLLVRSMSITEELGEPFEIVAELVSEKHDVDFDEVLAKPCAIRLELGTGATRHFHGIVAEFSQSGSVGELASYRAVIVPWTWLATRTSHCRTFQAMTRPDIVQSVLKENGTDIELRLTESYQPEEFVVQYRETNHNFINRLLEHEGITYYFTHTDAKHSIVLADSPAAYEPFPGYEKIRFSTEGFDRADEQQGIRTLSMRRVVTPARVVLNDFDPLVPTKDLLRKHEQTWKGTATGEMYDYPGDFDTAGDGDTFAQRRLEELQAYRHVISGTGNARGIAVGHVFEIESPPRSDLKGKKWLVTDASYQVIVDDYGASAGGGGASFSVSFSAIESTVAFRPERVTPSPVISGPQTAMVVGRAGEEITVDAHGRVKVLFHWDRFAKGDETSSCWVRVSQAWAGKSWGSMFLPRHGQEVIVEFIEGDPDRPIITGRVYNGESKPPYKLPDFKETSGFKSNKSKGGGAANEFRFDDKAGEEQVFLHAMRNYDIRVVKDALEWIGENRHLIVVKDRMEQVKHDDHLTVDNDSFTKIGKDLHLSVAGKVAMKVEGSRSVKVTGADASEFGADVAQKVTGNFFVKAAGVTIEATSGITLKCGGNSVVIDASGVTVKGAQVVIDGTMTRINSGPGSPPVPGTPGTLVAPTDPKAPDEAIECEPGSSDAEVKGRGDSAATSTAANTKVAKYHTPASAAEEKTDPHWIEIVLKDEKGNPKAGERYMVILPDGSTAATGTLDEKGFARVDGLDPGNCSIRFPDLESDEWKAS